MAPEILVTKPYNELTDIWSLGIIAYELAVGQNPYQGMTLNRIMFAAKNQKAPEICAAHGLRGMSDQDTLPELSGDSELHFLDIAEQVTEFFALGRSH